VEMSSPPAFSMGKSQRSDSVTKKDRDLAQVGPGSYQASLIDKKREPSFSMGARVQAENTKLNTPGAGSYEAKSKILESPGKTMGVKFEQKAN